MCEEALSLLANAICSVMPEIWIGFWQIHLRLHAWDSTNESSLLERATSINEISDAIQNIKNQIRRHSEEIGKEPHHGLHQVAAAAEAIDCIEEELP